MQNQIDFSGRPFHFIGIGGIGMSALAYILAKSQWPVYGSDIRSSHITQSLQEIGAHIFWHQDASNLDFFRQRSELAEKHLVSVVASELGESGLTAIAPRTEVSKGVKVSGDWLPQVICSTAINRSNEEYRAALDLGCPIFHRSDLLAALMGQYPQSIAVAGTHGKTTTSSAIGYMLLSAGLDPTIVVGGEVNAWGGNARMGNSPLFVAEADESDGSLVKLAAKIGVVTNIELDHPDHYESIEQVVATFQGFQQQCETLIGSIDCPIVRERLQPSVSYSLRPEAGADYTVDCVAYRADGTTARVWEHGAILGQLSLSLLGEHNLSNALAVVAVGRWLGLDFETIAAGLANFEGSRRRFERRGEANGILFVDDYAHHPSEIRATLSSARLNAKGLGVTAPRRVVAIFQPHRYSRTEAFLSEFAESFGEADLVVVSDIYSAGEPNLGKISGKTVAEAVSKHHPRVHYQSSLESVAEFLKETLMPGDLALFLGAGNLNQMIPELMAFHREFAAPASSRHPA
ncbi:MAG TPA: UDP-N-acetylmuramate--L-alanine ligase [Oscillatoriaceae cyanobacterium M33_DOE_052]|uniref:UDP-N-acetylmuramate--L-alanine ligase n=1 Tax=Planktothricoides sp. SpSt-374 TaxID=2282167 RepID=A0A7C3ZKY2_9CYAN|nr:UDP-N-acetylmuramate--L-alanine ligase [Oscillatoriaceae cyanobacterium M33_DOE_052]